MKKQIVENYKKLANFIKRNSVYSYMNLVLLIIGVIMLIINNKLGIIYFIIDLILNLILIEFGGIEYMKSIKTKNNTKKEKKVVKTKKKSKKKKIFRVLLNIFLFFLLIALILFVIFMIYIVIKAPDFNPKNLYKTESSIVYDKSGNQITKLGIEKRKNVSYNDLPQVLIDAILATEDSRFMQHNGFDAPRFIKASFGQVINKITGHGNAGGGSTLSMQVVKNDYTSTVSSGWEGIVRKFTDIYISVFKLEKNYSKEEIIEFYVNTPFLGSSSYGVEQACQSYFGKSVSDINLAEAAIIAGLFQAPSSYDPNRYPENTEARRKTVLYLMKKHGYITEREEKIANSIPVKSLLKNKNSTSTGSSEYQSYIDAVIDEVEEKTGNNPYTAGMKIYTNLDTAKQTVLNKIYSGETWKWKDEKINAGFAIVDVNNGELVAIGGGRNQVGERQFNYGTMIKRQIGSCAKPLFDYGPAYEYNGASEATQVLDAPYSYSGGGAIKNADGGYGGLMTYKYAMAASRNIPAVKVFQSVDNSKIVEFVTRLGLTPEIDSNGYIHEAHALGAFDGTSPKQMAGAYAAFANGGYYSEPYTVSKVEYINSGKTVSLKPKRIKAMSDSTAYMITDALLYAVNGYGNIGGSVPGVQLAAKTGTSNFSTEVRRKYGFPSSANNDMWVTGYTPEYAVSMWYGYSSIERGYYNGNEGYSARGRLFRQIISEISEKGKTFNIPSSVVKATIEKETFPGLLPSANTPDDMKVTEYFKKGTVPTEASQRYAALANPTSLNAEVTDTKVNLSWGASKGNSYFTQNTLANSLKGLYLKEASSKAAEIIAGNGEFGYEIFAQTSSGTRSLGFTTATKYSANRENSDTTYIVKACYSINRASSSSGVSTKVKGTNKKEENKDNLENKEETVEISFNDGDSINISIANGYTDRGLKINNEEITNYTITSNNSAVSISGSGLGSTCTFSETGTFTLNYEVTYKDKIYNKKKTITVN